MLTAESVKSLGKALLAAHEKNKSEECLKLLRDLEHGVKPTEELLKETKIGMTVNKLARKSGDKRVVKEAKRVVGKWKDVLGVTDQKGNGKDAAKKKDGDSAPQTTSNSPDTVPQVTSASLAADGSPSTTEPAEAAAVVQRRKRSESPTPPNEMGDTSPPACKKPKTDNGESETTPEPAAVKNDDKNKDKAARTHKSDKVDFATRLTAAAPRCPQKAYKNRLRCCESLYDALASESEATSAVLAERALAVENATWDKAEKDKGKEGALAAYTPHMRSLYQHLRSAKTPSLRQDLVSGTLSAQQLVDMSPADFRTAEQKALDEAVQQQLTRAACFSSMSVAEDMRQSVMWRGGGR
ncbi:RNA polymerase II elongation factor [Rhodotorula mucilaginosa]|uniref:RNA polymerase II elongation factor n=1 Tax=Rhodotorula mucilaginosa TaxID=5537 RepID=A0A9P7B8I6_RHOMI|nr:RNA polymerase II elongation factor [Rhodotorula mucilaginosa]